MARQGAAMDGSNQWYMAIGGHQVGPVTQQEIISNLQNGSIDAETLVFSAGMTQWQKLKDVPAFAAYVKGAGGAAGGQAPGSFTPPPARGRHRLHDPGQRDAVRRSRARSRRRRRG